VVKFVALRERTDAESGERKGMLDYSIRNSGKSKIDKTSFSCSFATDRSSYHFTVVDDNDLKSGAIVYGHVEIAYADPEEKGKLDAATVDSTQFE
jgi:hypothetical protein